LQKIECWKIGALCEYVTCLITLQLYSLENITHNNKTEETSKGIDKDLEGVN